MKKLILSIVLIVFLFTLTGCYDASTIENSYYIIAMGIDLSENNNYSISVQIAKNATPSADSSSTSSQSSNYTIYTVEADTIDSGVSILNNYLNKKINLSHCSAIIISEDLAKAGIGNLLNSLSNNHEIRPDTFILISSKKASNVLEKVSNSGENFSSRFYEYIINSVDYTGYSVGTNFNKLLSEINDTSGDAVTIYTSVGKNTIQNNGIAIFKNDRMVGHTTASQSIAHLLLTNKLKQSIITIDNPFEENSKIDLSLSIAKNNKANIEIINSTPYISYDIFINSNIETSGKHFDYTSSENIKIIENKASEYLENLITDYLYTISKEYNADILNLQNLYSKKCITNKDLEDAHFKDIYKESFFKVNVNFKIASTHLFEKE